MPNKPRPEISPVTLLPDRSYTELPDNLKEFHGAVGRALNKASMFGLAIVCGKAEHVAEYLAELTVLIRAARALLEEHLAPAHEAALQHAELVERTASPPMRQNRIVLVDFGDDPAAWNDTNNWGEWYAEGFSKEGIVIDNGRPGPRWQEYRKWYARRCQQGDMSELRTNMRVEIARMAKDALGSRKTEADKRLEEVRMPAADSEPVEWSIPLGVGTLATYFNCNRRAMSNSLKAQAVRKVKLSRQRYMVALQRVPDAYREKCRAKKKASE